MLCSEFPLRLSSGMRSVSARCFMSTPPTLWGRFNTVKSSAHVATLILKKKSRPASLAALMEAMSEHPRVTYEEGNRSLTVDSGRAMFLLVSDVGAEGINAAVLRYRRRSDVAPVRGVVDVVDVVVVVVVVSVVVVLLLRPAALQPAFSHVVVGLSSSIAWEEENVRRNKAAR